MKLVDTEVNFTGGSIEYFDLKKVGTKLQLAGAIWTGQGEGIITLLPNENQDDLLNTDVLVMDLEEWKAFIHQTDILETEILKKEPQAIVKAIVRKSQRQIDQGMQWKVFQRDGYRCQYCGKTGIPLTVDHVVLWEQGGPTTDDNLITACRKCNKTRGNMEFEDWLVSRQYEGIKRQRDVSIKDQTTIKTIELNLRQMMILSEKVEKLVHTRSR